MEVAVNVIKRRRFRPKYPCLRPAGGACVEAGKIKCPALKHSGSCPFPGTSRMPTK